MATHVAFRTAADPIDRRAAGETADCDLHGRRWVAGAVVFTMSCALFAAPVAVAVLVLVGTIR